MPVGPRIHPDGQDKFSGRENESSWLTTDAANPCKSSSARRKRKKRGIFCDFFWLVALCVDLVGYLGILKCTFTSVH